jgi:hypothetical protein
MALVFGAAPQGEKEPLVYVKHLEPPVGYPPIARAARLQGVVKLKLTIAGDGSVMAADSTADDPALQAPRVLRGETEKLVRKWTFGCFNCPPARAYVHTLKFVWKLEGEGRSSNNATVVMDLPNLVTVTANPPECDHCPSLRPSKKN